MSGMLQGGAESNLSGGNNHCSSPQRSSANPAAVEGAATQPLEIQLLRAQRLEGIGVLASGVAHDLNNILTPILMAADMLQSSADTRARNQHLLRIMRDSAQRGADFVRHLLMFDRGLELLRAEVQPRTLLKELARVIVETVLKCISLRRDFPSDLWPILAYPRALHLQGA